MNNKILLNEGVDFTSQFASASTTIEKQNVINDFFNAIEANYKVKFDAEAKSFLQSAFMNMSNQYLKDDAHIIRFFIYFSKFNPAITITKPICENIFNLFGDNIVNENNLLARSPVGSEDIIFVNDLYTKDYNSIKYLCQVYYWLNNKSNIESLHLEKLFSDDDITKEFCNRLSLSYPTLIALFNFTKDKDGVWRDKQGRFAKESDIFANYSPKQIACLFCFIDCKFSYSGKLRNAQVIEDTMNYIDAIQGEVNITTDNKGTKLSKDFESILKSMSVDDLNALKAAIDNIKR